MDRGQKNAGAGGPWIGRPLPRFEDFRLLRGAGRFTDDVSLPGEVFAAFVRSPHAHALIKGVEAAAARAMPGVLAVLTGADYAAAGFGGFIQGAVSADAVEWTRPAFMASMGHLVHDKPHIPFAIDKARFPGEPVAMVVAETREQARDAAEAVEVAYEVLPAVVDGPKALEPGAPQIWDDVPGNLAIEADVNDRTGLAEAFAGAAHVVEGVFRSQRTVTAQMEPRAALGQYDAATGDYLLISGCQGVHRLRSGICAAMNLPMERLRVVTPDVGGGFGTRINSYTEQLGVLWAAKIVGRPVKWTGERNECCLADYQGRDSVTKGRLGLDETGRIVAYDVEIVSNIGAHMLTFTPLHNSWRVGTTVYDIPRAGVRLRGAMSNTVPIAPYRGAGRPEATLVIERLLDMAAQDMGIDRIDLRRRNLIARSALPYRTASGLTYDSGDFAGNLELALQLADWSGFEARRLAAAKRGKLAGIGLANSMETPVGAPHERVELAVNPEGRVELVVGTQSSGQGHETSFAQVVADMLGVTPWDVRLTGGDTALVESGGGTHSDRSMRLAGALMVEASEAIVAQGKLVAAALMEVAPSEVSFEDGFFQTIRNNQRFDIFDLARAVAENAALPDDLRAPLAAKKTLNGRIPAYPTSCAICEVEVDPDTGEIAIIQYATADDAGQPVNPLILHGQVHGGIAQGAGPALIEGVAYDPGSGQVLTGSFMDYAVPRADMFPMFKVAATEDPTLGNVLRVKGGGEGGTTPASAVIINAVLHALAPLGVRHLDMPATPQRVWAAIRAAKA